MKKVGIVGWRGMVGSVLMDRMTAEGDFDLFEPVFFSTSNAGGNAPSVHSVGGSVGSLQDAKDLQTLSKMDAIVTAQGGDYTSAIYEPLRKSGWSGYWIDAASTLRMRDDTIIILDPVNQQSPSDCVLVFPPKEQRKICGLSDMVMVFSRVQHSGAFDFTFFTLYYK